MICISLAVLCVATLFGLFSGATPHSIKSTNTDAELRAQQTLEGLFNYYWNQDPTHKGIKFFFACGQIGEISNPDQCSCNSPGTCLDCYRWWSGVSLESVATYGIYMNTTNHSNVADMTFKHSPYNSNWNPNNAFIDDFLWYGITYLRVYEWLKVSQPKVRQDAGNHRYLEWNYLQSLCAVSWAY